jgi:uncharacterized protein (DUF1330 family)
MPAYVIAEIQVSDPVRYEDYRKQVLATIEAYGGRFLVRGGSAELLEGNRNPDRIVLLEFESLERAKAWWDSEEYRSPKALRQETAEARILLVGGI